MNRIPIRLTDERWEHITCWHPELQGSEEDILHTVREPDRVRRGYGGALVAERRLGKQNYLLVIYKELSKSDGFIVTARVSRKPCRGEIVWQK